MKWTREQRYKRYEEYGEAWLASLEKQVAASPFRQTFHIQPKTGLLNDPNGFSYFNGAYHLFYQWFPMGPVHGVKYWGHMVSTDLVHWEDKGIALAPDTQYDSHGVFSGSGQVVGDSLYLMYTGNVRDSNWQRTPHQLMAVMDQNGEIKKQVPPVIEGIVPGYTDHFRDPKIWQQGTDYYAIFGAQRENQTGSCVLYHSEDLRHWTFVTEIATQLADFGYMWECPDYFELAGKGVLLFSPQGIPPERDRYLNLYQTGYIVGQPLDVTNGAFQHEAFQELDAGFDFYATQTMNAPDGRRLLVAWMGLPELAYPSDRDGWAHCLTIPRELRISENNQLQQVPIKELETLRETSEKLTLTTNETIPLAWQGEVYELEVELHSTANQFGLILRSDNQLEKGTLIYVDQLAKKLVVDRTTSGESFAEEYGTTRKVPYEDSTIQLRIYVDRSSIEIFVNEGDHTFTLRIFPEANQLGVALISKAGTTTLVGKKWTLKN